MSASALLAAPYFRMIGCFMTDEHQPIAIVATAILQSCRDLPDSHLDPEEAKIVAKCILAALKEAGFEVTVTFETRPSVT